VPPFKHLLIVISIMPSDYSNTIVYKIHCKDAAILDTYVGHTTNFQLRQMQHKCASNNLKKQFKLYNTIRANGGWSNWEMVELNRYNCKDFTEARKKEQIHYEELNPSLNSVAPASLYNGCHKNVSGKIMSSEVSKFSCEVCHFKCNKKGDWNRHIHRAKHISLTVDNGNNVMHDTPVYLCVHCKKSYSSRNGLWKHKFSCEIQKDKTSEKNQIIYADNILNKDELIISLLKQNADLMLKIAANIAAGNDLSKVAVI